MQPLPIDAVRDDLRRACARSPRLVVTAPTGSGKSTRIPGFLLDDGFAGDGAVICLQPRRLAARMLARRVAAERRSGIGEEVGYRVRFDHRVGPATRLVYETDGILLQDLLGRPTLPHVGAIVFDEFHERHLFGDVLLGLALRLQRTTRPDLRIVVMSATLETTSLRAFLDPCEVLQSEGRAYPVDIRYLPARQRADAAAPWDLTAQALAESGSGPATGHTLVFMPGAYEIRRTIETLQSSPAARGQRVVPLYGDLSPEAQDAAVAPAAEPRIIVATNIAETSITIDGVTRVVDSGLVRQAGYDPAHGINTLLIEKISRASADQRAGRAGRTAPGLCLRLWTEDDHSRRPAHETPEIARLDLAEVVLRLHALGLNDVAGFPWLEAPPPERIQATEQFLRDLGALQPDGGPTLVGRRMLDFPLHPRWARLLLAADAYGCVGDAALMAALSQERSILVPASNRDVRERRLDLADPQRESDMVLLMRLWRHAADQRFDRTACDRVGLHAVTCRRVGELLEQFAGIAASTGLTVARTPAETDRVLKCLLAAFPDQVARRTGSGSSAVLMVHGRRGSLEAHSAVHHARLLVAPEIHRVGGRRGEPETRITLASEIDAAWLQELYPEHIRHERTVNFNTVLRRVEAREDTRYLDLVLDEGVGRPPHPDEAARCLADEVTAGRVTLKEWDAAVEQWILRVNSLAAWCPELGIPPVDADGRRHLVEQICHGAMTYRDIKDRPVWPVVRGWLSAAQRALLDEHAPERITLSNGKAVKLLYEPSLAPSFSARIQDLYDVKRCPAIALGRVRVRACILAPNNRPVQITDDLASFWVNGYPQARKDLRGRYPKHEWR